MGYPRGVKEQNKYLSGGKLSIRQAILAKCADCLGLYVDGKADCAMPDCPLYPWMVYGAVWKGRQKGKKAGIVPTGFIKHLFKGKVVKTHGTGQAI